MRKLILRFATVSCIALFLIQFVWVVIRIAARIDDERAYFDEPSRDSVYVVSRNGILLLMLDQIEIPILIVDEKIGDSGLQIDFDKDGLSIANELIRLTSDNNIDSDGDGISDRYDSSPNSNSDDNTVTGSVVNLVLMKHLELLGYHHSRKVFAHYRVGYSGCYSRPDTGITMVCVTEVEGIFLRTRGVDEIFRVQMPVDLPGLAYVVSSWREGGVHGSDGLQLVVWDIPFLGPRLIATF